MRTSSQLLEIILTTTSRSFFVPQRTLSECIVNTLSERRLGNGLSHALNVLFSKGENSQHQQALVREKIDLHEKCPIPDVDVLEQTKHSSVEQWEMPFAFYKDFVPKPKNFLNQEVKLQVFFSGNVEKATLASFFK